MRSLIRALLGIASVGMSALAYSQIDIYTEHFPPYQYEDTEGEMSGRATLMVRALMAQAQLEYQIYMLPWHRAKQQFEHTPNALIYSIARTKIREHQYHWVMPLCELKIGFYKRVDGMVELPHYTADILKHYVIGVAAGQPSLQYLKEESFEENNLVKLNSLNQAGGMLEKGRVDFLFGAQNFVEQMAMTMGTEDKWELVLEVPKLTARLYLAAQKETNKTLLAKLMLAAIDINKLKLNTTSACKNSAYIQ
ncbi:hypothetical protein PSECIP111951_03932 [Pseudoalteromonas holothuriae]|uniref:Solute-binding protein family 3/N-terminal domain-containing protein n=1 Tax=Pseudoalteromonas holothuriae TaxID=2963714 RepID=A0ABN8URD0_9GAMM|nr:transporter substrate-binding domain-containing protein [Pseudoalteromonas sp. CIP111951]CAH9067895.1 hypothetical protein PSECIP111951_03932 [Pseudoalteromonas sp. CIP111951]